MLNMQWLTEVAARWTQLPAYLLSLVAMRIVGWDPGVAFVSVSPMAQRNAIDVLRGSLIDMSETGMRYY